MKANIIILSRRHFLLSAVGTTAALTIPGWNRLDAAPLPVAPLPVGQHTDAGFRLHRYVEFRSLARRILMIDDIPLAHIPQYECDNERPALIAESNAESFDSCTAEDCLVPTFEFATEMSGKLYAKNPDKEIARVGDQFINWEISCVVRLFEAALRRSPSQWVRARQDDYVKLLNKGFMKIERHDLVVQNVLMNSDNYLRWRKSPGFKDRVDEIQCDMSIDLVRMGLLGHIWTANILVHPLVPKDRIYISSAPENIGAIPVRSDPILITHADGGWVAVEEVGFALIHPQSLCVITL